MSAGDSDMTKIVKNSLTEKFHYLFIEVDCIQGLSQRWKGCYQSMNHNL